MYLRNKVSAEGVESATVLTFTLINDLRFSFTINHCVTIGQSNDQHYRGRGTQHHQLEVTQCQCQSSPDRSLDL